jgi:hypothetical protein
MSDLAHRPIKDTYQRLLQAPAWTDGATPAPLQLGDGTDTGVAIGSGVVTVNGHHAALAVVHPFAFGDASQAVFTAAAAVRVVAAAVSVRTPFNGAGAAVRVGRVGDGSPPDNVLAAADTDVSAAAVYTAAADVALAAGDQLYLTISPGTGGSAGAGVLTIHIA